MRIKGILVAGFAMTAFGPLLAWGQAQMVTSGQPTVANGAATYTIPLKVPPGVAGVAPQLAFVYNSQAGNGSIGIGWGLSGLSAITRCPQTKPQDDKIRPVNFSLDDRFCLDGQRLVLVAGGSYGAAGTEYRTEIDSFSKIVANGSAGGAGPASFTVWTKAGEIIDYGNTADSRIEAQGKSAVRVWAINRIRDTKSNYQDFVYTEDSVNGDYNVGTIKYGGNVATGIGPNTEVRFEYETREDVQDLRQAGSRIKTTLRLKTVQTWSSTSKVREYRLLYRAALPATPSRLWTIQECAGDGTCLPHLEVAWSVHSDSLINAGYAAQNAHGNFDGSGDYIYVGDFNGDGRLDLLLGPTATGGWWVMRSTGTALDPGMTAAWIEGAYSGWDAKRIHVVDFNGDGLSDVVLGPDFQGKWFLLRSTGTSFTNVGEIASGLHAEFYGMPDQVHPAEINGDGLPDFILGPWTNGIWKAVRSTGTALVDVPGWIKSTPYGTFNGSPRRIRIMDVNGDGLSDVVLGPEGSTGKWYVLTAEVNPGVTSSAITFTDRGTWATGLYGSWSSDSSQKRIRVADANGDGLADLVIGPERTGQGGSAGNWFVLRSTGTGFENGGVWKTGAYADWNDDSDRIRNMDLNGDGLSDVLLGPKGGGPPGEWYGMLSTSTGFQDRGVIATGYHEWDDADEQSRIREMDLTGDGLPEVVLGPDHDGNWYQLQSAAPGNLVGTISDGFGMTVSFDYKPLTDSTVYAKDTGATYPVTDLQTSLWVASAMRTSNGVGGVLTRSYKYGGLKADVSGRGSLGFRWIEEKDEARNIVVRTEFSQTWPFVGMPLITKTTTLQPGAGGPQGLLRQVLSNYECLNPVSGSICTIGPGQRYFPFATNVGEAAWDLNGAAFPTSFMSYTYDVFGNATSIGSFTSDGFAKNTTNTYTNDTTKWFLGRLTRSTVAATLNGTVLTRTSAFTYDSTSGLLDKEIVEPDNSDLCLVTAYTHDGNGNRATSTVRNCNGSTGEAPAPSGAAVFTARTSRVFYDGRGLFPTTTQNALNQTESTVFEPKEGNLTSQTGPNALQTTWQYDVFGRRTLEIRADGTRTKWEYLYCSGYHVGTAWCPNAGSANYATHLVQQTPLASNGVTQNGPISTTYFDPLGRPIRAQTQAFDGVSWSFRDTWYDSVGRVQWTARPTLGQFQYWSFYSYDDLDRPISEAHPNSVGSFVYTTYGYNGVIRTITNPLSQVETRTTNSQGWLMSSKDNANQTITYQYDPYGNLKQTTDPSGNVNTFTYDLRGRKTAMSDRDMGSWSYVYNALGELTQQTNARSEVTNLEYDPLGRMTRRVEPSITANWFYDRYANGSSCVRGIGKLCEATASGTAVGTGGYVRKHVYDNLGRPSSTSASLDGTATTSVTYDAHGRVATQTYPTGFAVGYQYTGLGYLRLVFDNATSATFWQADTMDAEGRVTQETLGNGVVARHIFEQPTGRISQILAGPGDSIESLALNYDNIGRMTSRIDSTQSLSESFQYDNLNRVTQAWVTAPAVGQYTTTYGYNAIGNLTSRSDLGTYTYPASGPSSTRPHAVSTVNYSAGGRREYGYDGNGNVNSEVAYDSAGQVLPANGRSALYYSFNKPLRLTTFAAQTLFSYNGEYQPYYQQTETASGLAIVWSLHPDSSNGLLYEKEIRAPGFVLHEHRHYVTAAGVVVAMVKQDNAGTRTTQYVHRDHLGSVVATTDSSGTVLERLAYDSFGKRRQANGQTDPNNQLTSAQTDRGFTNHRHLDPVDLIHTNGRIYDPTIGRFMGADPFVQNPGALQSYNRYSYAFNNPLIYTDPSGYFWGIGGSVKRELRRWERDFRHEIRRPGSLLGPVLQTAGAGLSLLCHGAAPACVAATTAAVSRAQGVTGSALVRSAAISAATAYAFSQVGSITPAGSLERILGHGIVGGYSSLAAGGDLSDVGSGFLASALSSTVELSGNRLKDTVWVAIVGGTSSTLTGGKFANGVVTGSFGYLFNATLHDLLPAEGHPISPEELPGLNELNWAADIAARTVDSSLAGWLPWVRGRVIHIEFARMVKLLGTAFTAEQTYYLGEVERYGYPGGVRADAVYGNVSRPLYAYELKTGIGMLQNWQRDRYRDHLPKGTRLIVHNPDLP